MTYSTPTLMTMGRQPTPHDGRHDGTAAVHRWGSAGAELEGILDAARDLGPHDLDRLADAWTPAMRGALGVAEDAVDLAGRRAARLALADALDATSAGRHSARRTVLGALIATLAGERLDQGARDVLCGPWRRVTAAREAS